MPTDTKADAPPPFDGAAFELERLKNIARTAHQSHEYGWACVRRALEARDISEARQALHAAATFAEIEAVTLRSA